MPPPPRNPDHQTPKRPRRYVIEDEETEDDTNDYTEESSDDDDEDDVYTDESADEEQRDEEEAVEVVAGGVIGVARRTGGSPSASSSSSSSSQLSVKLNSSEILDCPTCLEPLKTPIYQCRNGHITCSPCLPKVYNQCPVCRIPIGDIRCRAMEKVIESSAVPCCNAIYGCKETLSYGNQSAHEKECVHIPCSCPVTNCDYTGAYKNVESHARAQHSWDVENLIPFVFDTPQIFSINLARKKTAVFQEEKEGDLIVVQVFKEPHYGGVAVTVSRIAPLSSALRNLSCSIARLNAYTTLKLGLMVKRIQNVREQEEPLEDYFFIPDYMLSRGDHLKMQICVGNELMYLQF